jgi:hypothetical protein
LATYPENGSFFNLYDTSAKHSTTNGDHPSRASTEKIRRAYAAGESRESRSKEILRGNPVGEVSERRQ